MLVVLAACLCTWDPSIRPQKGLQRHVAGGGSMAA